MPTPTKSLDDQRRRRLLQDLTALKSDVDDAVQDDPKWFLFLDSHARALKLETMIVRGGRGAGKSALFAFLQHVRQAPDLANSVEIPFPIATWVDGFSAKEPHPSFDTMGAFDKQANDADRRAFWLAWLCVQLAEHDQKPTLLAIDSEFASREPAQLAKLGTTHVHALSMWLDSFHRSRASGSPAVVTYDRLDRIVNTPDRLIVSLLRLWLNLSDRYRSLRAKIFIREDLFNKSISAFPDASKLDGRSVSIDWNVGDLYRVLIKHMANTSAGLREWLEESANRVPLTLHGSMGWEPPTLAQTGKPSQKAFVDHLAGETMGAGAKKGYTVNWIPNRLQDAHARVVPRSMLALVRNAATEALQQGPAARNLKLLDPKELQRALRATSERRVAEVKEEFAAIARLENLRGKNVLIERKEVVRLLSKPIDGIDGAEDSFNNDGAAVLSAAIEQGVMSARSDGRIDVPDIYREAFGILRKGGVKRTQ